ncbi:MAG: PAS domain S-box protein [Kosmotogaceae bacterium]|nr:PAS domain S-box protein [Kosmotogaceae bacterium]
MVLSVTERLGKIIQRIETSRTLSENKEQYRATLSSIGDAVLSTDAFGMVTFVNEVACNLIGLSENSIIGKRVSEVLEVFSEDSGEPAIIPVEYVLRTGKKVGLANHTALRSNNGKIYSIADSAAPISREDGETTGVILVFRDVTEDRKNEERIVQSEARYRELIENMNGGLLILDSEDGEQFILKEFKAPREDFYRTGVSSSGKELRDVFTGVEKSGLFEAVRKVWKTGAPEKVEAEKYVYGDQEGWWTNYVYKLPSGEVVSLCYDVSESLRIQEFKKKTNDGLLTLSKMAAGSGFSLDEFMKSAVRIVGSSLCVDRAGIYMLNRIGEMDLIISSDLVDGEAREDKSRAMDRDVASEYLHLIQAKRFFSISDVNQEEKGNFIVSLQEVGVKAILDIPLRIRGIIVGSLFCDMNTARQWTSDEKSFAASVGDILTLALEEDELVNSEHRYKSFFKMNGVPMLLIDSATGSIVDSNEAACRFYEYDLVTLKGMSIKDLAANNESLVAIRKFAARRSISVVSRQKKASGRIVDVEIFASPFSTEDVDLINLIVVDITEALAAKNKLSEALGRLHTALEGAVELVSKVVEARDPYTAGHQKNVSRLATAIAEKLGLDDNRIRTVRIAGLLHDVGKVSIPAEILSKPGRLTDLEWSLIKRHPIVGYEILRDVKLGGPIAEIVKNHHERINGSGYPEGLTGSELSLESRIVAVADVVEAMVSHRPYRASRGLGEAVEEIKSNSGVLYDEEVVSACLAVIDSGFKIERSDCSGL